MANGKLYAFKRAGAAAVFVLVGDRRVWVNGQAMAAQMQVSLASGDVAVLDASNPLLTLPFLGPAGE